MPRGTVVQPEITKAGKPIGLRLRPLKRRNTMRAITNPYLPLGV